MQNDTMQLNRRISATMPPIIADNPMGGSGKKTKQYIHPLGPFTLVQFMEPCCWFWKSFHGLLDNPLWSFLHFNFYEHSNSVISAVDRWNKCVVIFQSHQCLWVHLLTGRNQSSENGIQRTFVILNQEIQEEKISATASQSSGYQRKQSNYKRHHGCTSCPTLLISCS